MKHKISREQLLKERRGHKSIIKDYEQEGKAHVEIIGEQTKELSLVYKELGEVYLLIKANGEKLYQEAKGIHRRFNYERQHSQKDN